jgi:quercetin dioxygenase-like cupin family protein
VAIASLKMLVDPNFGAAHLNFFVVQYADGGLINEHDHAFEEAYFFLQGEIEALADGVTHTLHAGDYFWTGIASPHAFTNRSGEPVRWVETQVPQPPVREAARFKADWPSA